ncbi:DUF3187 family protein [Steroidobacter flavus]|uniref:DUF3187 family protein n=1 Tax=Steroidobacter flavus TaxID=1842136 RepID=A0ABV8T3D3_9GAMM
MIKPLVILFVAQAAVLGCSPAMGAEAGEFYELLRARDQTPFGFLRLDMRPAYAGSLEKGETAFEVEVGYQNTWASSPNVEKYLTSLESQGRRALGAAELQAIRDLPGENYLVDLESATLDIIVHYKFAEHWTGYLIASGVSYQGGFLDSTIESFHDAFGFSSFGRPAVRKNQINYIYDLKGAQLASLDAPSDGGVLDPTLGVRYAGWGLPDRWALSLEAAVKVPVDGTRQMLSTGHYDYGLQASLQRHGDRHAVYVDVAAVYYGGTDFPARQDAQVIPTLIVGYEYRLTPTTNINLQAYASTSADSKRLTDLDELTGNKYQYSLGIRHRRGRALLTFGVTENVQNLNNTPDIGFQLGIAYLPLRSQT